MKTVSKVASMFRLAFWAVFALAPAFHAMADTPMPVVATFSILGDLVKNVGGDRVAVTTLVGPNGDTHAYTPKPTDVKKLVAAKLIFINGLDFERWLDRLIDSSKTDAQVVTVSDRVNPQSLPETKAARDPHAWQAVPNVAIYVRNIRDALIAADAASKDVYIANAQAYTAQLDELDRSIRETVARIPESKRRVVTQHPSFQYFAAAYGLRFSSPRHLSDESEASAKNIAAMIDTIKRDNVSALFMESAGDPRMMQQIASETGVKIGGALYADALTEANGPAPNYLALMRYNLHAIQTALQD